MKKLFHRCFCSLSVAHCNSTLLWGRLLHRSPQWVINLQPSSSDGAEPSFLRLLPLILSRYTSIQDITALFYSYFNDSPLTSIYILLSGPPPVSYRASSGDSECIRIRGSLPLSWSSFGLCSTQVQLLRSLTHAAARQTTALPEPRTVWVCLYKTSYCIQQKTICVITSISDHTASQYHQSFFVMNEAGGLL